MNHLTAWPRCSASPPNWTRTRPSFPSTVAQRTTASPAPKSSKLCTTRRLHLSPTCEHFTASPPSSPGGTMPASAEKLRRPKALNRGIPLLQRCLRSDSTGHSSSLLTPSSPPNSWQASSTIYTSSQPQTGPSTRSISSHARSKPTPASRQTSAKPGSTTAAVDLPRQGSPSSAPTSGAATGHHLPGGSSPWARP